MSFVPDGQEFIHLSCSCPPRISLRKHANTNVLNDTFDLYVDEFQQSVIGTHGSSVSDEFQQSVMGTQRCNVSDDRVPTVCHGDTTF